jgi:hypothetical protein
VDDGVGRERPTLLTSPHALLAIAAVEHLHQPGLLGLGDQHVHAADRTLGVSDHGGVAGDPDAQAGGDQFQAAVQLFKPLLVSLGGEAKSPSAEIQPTEEKQWVDGISADLERFMEMYPDRRSRAFGTDQELWALLRGLQQRLSNLQAIRSRPTVRVAWSVGQGNWARVPWISLLDIRLTDTTQRGVYIVFLFREDMSGVYLTLSQGVTEPKTIHGATAGLQLLRENASLLRNSCNGLSRRGFSLNSEIDLRTEGTLGRDYEAATIAYKFYERGDVPHDQEIAYDIDALAEAYDQYVQSQSGDPAIVQVEPRPIATAPPYTMVDALSELFLEQPELEELLDLWRLKKNVILQGSPGVGKTFTAKRLGYLLMGHRDQARSRMV